MSFLSVFRQLVHSDQVGWGIEQPGLVEGVPAHGRGVGTRRSVRSLPTQTILLFCDSMAFLHFLKQYALSVKQC